MIRWKELAGARGVMVAIFFNALSAKQNVSGLDSDQRHVSCHFARFAAICDVCQAFRRVASAAAKSGQASENLLRAPGRRAPADGWSTALAADCTISFAGIANRRSAYNKPTV